MKIKILLLLYLIGFCSCNHAKIMKDFSLIKLSTQEIEKQYDLICDSCVFTIQYTNDSIISAKYSLIDERYIKFLKNNNLNNTRQLISLGYEIMLSSSYKNYIFYSFKEKSKFWGVTRYGMLYYNPIEQVDSISSYDFCSKIDTIDFIDSNYSIVKESVFAF